MILHKRIFGYAGNTLARVIMKKSTSQISQKKEHSELISPQYRKMMIQRLVNEIEAFINEVLKY